jgi:RNA polymerase sigma-70 factor (ECF subfamily)
MHEEPTTVIIQRYLDALPRDAAAAGPVIRELLARAVERLRLLCGTLLYKSYPRLTRPAVNLQTDALVGGAVAGLLSALRTTRPRPCGSFSRWPVSICAGSAMTRPAA